MTRSCHHERRSWWGLNQGSLDPKSNAQPLMRQSAPHGTSKTGFLMKWLIYLYISNYILITAELWMDGLVLYVHYNYFSHIRTMEGWTCSAQPSGQILPKSDQNIQSPSSGPTGSVYIADLCIIMCITCGQVCIQLIAYLLISANRKIWNAFYNSWHCDCCTTVLFASLKLINNQ